MNYDRQSPPFLFALHSFLYNCTIFFSDATAPQVWVQVDYVDYGNSEKLPLDRVRPLAQQFCGVPCQALTCSVAGIEPMCVCNNTNVMQNKWSSDVCNWLSKLILGRSVKIVVLRSKQDNEVSVDVYLPADSLLGTESFANFPMPAQSLAKFSRLKSAQSLISLASFMSSVGLAKLVMKHDVLPKEVHKGYCCTHLELPLSPKEGVQDNERVHSESVTSPIENAICSKEQVLHSLRVELDSSGEFTLLISCIVNPSKFFVHPIQENIASDMVELSNSLNQHYLNPNNDMPLSEDYAHSGTFCCVYADNDQQWYRGIITDVRGNSASKECLVFSIDYGDSSWVPLSSLQVLKEEFFSFPPLCICCSLFGASSATLTEWEEDCMQYFRKLTEGLTLVAAVCMEGIHHHV